jgi:hypothetical protein
MMHTQLLGLACMSPAPCIAACLCLLYFCAAPPNTRGNITTAVHTRQFRSGVSCGQCTAKYAGCIVTGHIMVLLQVHSRDQVNRKCSEDTCTTLSCLECCRLRCCTTVAGCLCIEQEGAWIVLANNLQAGCWITRDQLCTAECAARAGSQPTPDRH